MVLDGNLCVTILTKLLLSRERADGGYFARTCIVPSFVRGFAWQR